MSFSSRLVGIAASAVSVLFLTSGFVACGSSDGGGGGTGAGTDTGGGEGSTGDGFDTGVDGSKRPSDLSPEEIEQICDATQDYVYDAVSDEEICRALAAGVGFQTEDPVAACEASYAACMAAQAAEESSACVVDEDCDITVAEYEACVDELVTKAEPALSGFPPCDDVTPLTLLRLAALADMPACDVVSERCGSVLPELDPGDTDSDGAGSGGTSSGGTSSGGAASGGMDAGGATMGGASGL